MKKCRFTKKVLLICAACLCVAILAAGLWLYPHYHEEAERRELYEQAVATLTQTPLALDGSNEVSEALLVALANAEYAQPQNVILMIGDGMGFNIIEATQRVYRDQLYQGKMAMNHISFQSAQCTYSVSSDITDSAAGATALGTGYKTLNGTLAMDYTLTDNFETVMEMAVEKGKSTGLVVTKTVTDATPAAFVAHVNERTLQEEIAAQQMNALTSGSLDLLLGGGYSYFEAEVNQDVLTQSVAAGMNYTTSWEEASAMGIPLCGVFSEGNMDTTDADLPKLAQMTDLALRLLDQDDNGFFLMVEGSQIDTFGHANNYEQMVQECYDFDCAVAVVLRYIAMNPDTVLVITADHETGDLWIPAVGTETNTGEYDYTTLGHSSKKVPVFAVGYGIEALSGIRENTDIGIFLASCLGVTDIGQTSTLLKQENAVQTVFFGPEHEAYSLSDGKLPELSNEDDLITVIHVETSNPGDTVLPVPELALYTGKKYIYVEAQVDYIQPGESLVLSYTMPFDYRTVPKYSSADFSLVLPEGESSLTVGTVYLTTRPFGR